MTKHIVVVEDDLATAEELQEFLQEEGFLVSYSRNGADMWKLLETCQAVDLFLLDLTLPGGSGLELAKEIRRKSEVGIIILTGKISEMDRVVGLEIGADDYVTKPFSLRELVARIHGVLRRTSGKIWSSSCDSMDDSSDKNDRPDENTVQILEFDLWKLNTWTRSLFDSDGSEISLTTAEYNLLLALANNPQRILSRDQLLQRMYDRDYLNYERTIDGTISHLRKKLSNDNGTEYIKTIRGAGYMFTLKPTIRNG